MVSGRYIATELGPDLHRLEMPAAALGFYPPPAYTEITLRKGRGGWTLRALSAKGDVEAMSRWLRALGASEVQPGGPREAPLKATFARLPPTLGFMVESLDVQQVGLGSDGSAFVVAAGRRTRFKEVMQVLEAQRVAEDAIPELTARQAELLEFCEERGYYRIPRKVTLRDLALELDISPPALSMALRRAEARILSAYVERLRHSLPRQAARKGKGKA